MQPDEYLQRVRDLCRELPDSGEKLSWGHPNFTAGGRMFAAFGSYGHRGCLAIATSHEQQAFLIQDERFAVAPYVGKQGWVVAWLEHEPEWSMLEDLLRSAHARVLAAAATKRRRPAKATRGSARKAATPKAPARKVTARKATGRKVTGRKVTGRRTKGRKATGRKAAKRAVRR